MHTVYLHYMQLCCTEGREECSHARSDDFLYDHLSVMSLLGMFIHFLALFFRASQFWWGPCTLELAVFFQLATLFLGNCCGIEITQAITFAHAAK